MKSTAKSISDRFRDHRRVRAPYDGLWNEISRIATVRPRDFSGTTPLHGGDWTRTCFDSTAQNCANRFRAIFLGLLTSPYDWWLRLGLHGDTPSYDTSQWLGWLEKTILASFRSGGFYDASSGVYGSVGFFGNAAVMMDERPYSGVRGFQGLRISEIPLEQCIFIEDGNGDVRHVIRFVEWTAASILSYFAGDGDIPQEIRDHADDVDRKWTCIHEVKPEKPGYQMTAYDSQWIIEEMNHTVRYASIPFNPYIAVRAPRSGGEIYGRGPAHDCLGSIRTLNYQAFLRRQNFAYRADPRFIANEAIRISGWENAGPGALIYANGDVGPQNLRELTDSTRPEYFSIMAEPEIQQVRQAFFADQIEFWNERPQDLKAGVAQEMGARNRILLSPVLSSLNRSYVIPAVSRAIQVIVNALSARNGGMQVPDEVLAGGINIDIVGPLAIAQKAARMQGYREFLADASAVMQLYPETRQEVNGGRTLRLLAETAYMPAEVLNSPAETQAIRDAEAAARAPQEALQTLSEGAPAMLDIARAAKELS